MYAIGAFLFVPAAHLRVYGIFLWRFTSSPLVLRFWKPAPILHAIMGDPAPVRRG